MAVNIFTRPISAPNPIEIRELVTLYQQSRTLDAMQKAQSLVTRFPKHPLGWTILGAIYRTEHNNNEALPCLIKVAELTPSDPNAHFNLANAYRDLGKPTEAIEHYRRAVKLKPAITHGFFHMGNMQHEAGLLPAAERSLRQALKLSPEHIETLSNLAHVLQDMGQLQQAVELYDRALTLQPANALLHYNRGDVLQELGQWNEAQKAASTAIQLAPLMPEAHAQMGDVLKELGQMSSSIEAYRVALKLAPDNHAIHSSLLFTLNYLPVRESDAHLKEALSFGQSVKARTEGKSYIWGGETAPHRLRVGMVSADFRNHPVGHFLEAVLHSIDNSRVELVALSTQTFEDDLTQRIHPRFREWHSIAGMSDAVAAQAVNKLGLHVLLDLSGHTAGNRLPLFAYRLAPVQASWLGYFATTGVADMDFLVADPVTLPDICERDFSEKIWRLPDTRLCFTAPKEKIEINPLPAISNQGITFGSFSNLIKLNDDVICLWSRILRSLPTSRLLIQAKQLRSAEMKDLIVNRFARHDISAEQLILEGPMARSSYLKAYHRVDVCLDPFPFPGGTTTAESLWMGVPVLTLEGSNFIGRQGCGLLAGVGLSDWITATADEYHQRAVNLADNIPALAILRQQLRSIALSSPIFDSTRFAKNLESALWGMWEQKKPA
ncbi:MAG: tetratricopeptide repeat protein [Acidovorax sp.]|nr:tetratricopeptide repeat protein [Acidovorax sp.]